MFKHLVRAAQAQTIAETASVEASPITASGSVLLTSGCRLRGDTAISELDAAYLRPSFSKGQDGTGNIAGSTFVLSLIATF